MAPEVDRAAGFVRVRCPYCHLLHAHEATRFVVAGDLEGFDLSGPCHEARGRAYVAVTRETFERLAEAAAT